MAKTEFSNRVGSSGAGTPLFVITATDTGVGKTVLTALLTRYLLLKKRRVAALKPICSGGRDDARILFEALEGSLPLNEINPWPFRAAQTPLLAARAEKKRLRLAAVLDHVRKFQAEFEVVLIEGAGGLLSPLGEGFSTRDWIDRLKAIPIVVCPNRLGAINQSLLVLSALPRRAAKRAHIVLMAPPHADLATRTNWNLLTEFVDAKRVHLLPRFRSPFSEFLKEIPPQINQVLEKICRVEPNRSA